MNKNVLLTDVAEWPQQAFASFVQTDDNIRVRIGSWVGDDVNNGTILILPGRTGYIERYGRIVKEFRKRGFASVAIDWRGHGLSDRLTENQQVCHVDRFEHYQSDLAAMMEEARKRNMPKPWYLVGNSLGATIGLRAISNGLNINACAFVSPMWGINMSKSLRLLAWSLTWAYVKIGKGHVFTPSFDEKNYVVNTQFGNNTLTSDKGFYKYWSNQLQKHPELQLGGPSTGWLYEGLKECKDLSQLSSPDIPCIAFYGSADNDIDTKSIINRMNSWQRGKIQRIEGGKHDLLSEVNHIQYNVISNICTFLNDYK